MLPALLVNPEALLFAPLESPHRTTWGAWAGHMWLESLCITGALWNLHRGGSWHEFGGRLCKCLMSLVCSFNWSKQIFFFFFFFYRVRRALWNTMTYFHCQFPPQLLAGILPCFAVEKPTRLCRMLLRALAFSKAKQTRYRNPVLQTGGTVWPHFF